MVRRKKRGYRLPKKWDKVQLWVSRDARNRLKSIAAAEGMTIWEYVDHLAARKTRLNLKLRDEIESEARARCMDVNELLSHLLELSRAEYCLIKPKQPDDTSQGD